jgi:hypothetical protein
VQIRLGHKIISKNLEEEIALSKIDPILNQAKITLLMDGGWDQRASGKAYNSSLSGRHVSVGGETKRVVNLIYFSKCCGKCEKGKVHLVNICANPEKYAKSLKAMLETIGMVRTVLDMWNNNLTCYVSTIITEEDRPKRAKLWQILLPPAT